ncbi:hypothetical protein Taro_026207 [Colocasia esculenta]|uniref:Uncharacterized protein n=1 Tax=Colocasia esculenta TaxID=4460 RepID=A0A843V5M8_COLES|nr:hypothetical protein [Colocasia esculenta]
MFELYVRLRERRQRTATCVCGCAVACSMLVGAQAEVPKGAKHGPAAVWSAGVVLVGLHYSLTLLCACGAAVGPFVRDCETERSCVVDSQGLPLSQSQRPAMWTFDVELSDRGSGPRGKALDRVTVLDRAGNAWFWCDSRGVFEGIRRE